MELTMLDRELLAGLQVLTDTELGRVQAHLAAGLPMKLMFGWEPFTMLEPACFGCLVGTAMSETDYDTRRKEGVQNLAMFTFLNWARARPEFQAYRHLRMTAQLDISLPQPILARLAALLDMEWSRRHPLSVETGKTLATNRQPVEVGS